MLYGVRVVVDSAYIEKARDIICSARILQYSDGDLFLLLRFSIYMCIKLCEFYVPKINL